MPAPPRLADCGHSRCLPSRLYDLYPPSDHSGQPDHRHGGPAAGFALEVVAQPAGRPAGVRTGQHADPAPATAAGRPTRALAGRGAARYAGGHYLDAVDCRCLQLFVARGGKPWRLAGQVHGPGRACPRSAAALHRRLPARQCRRVQGGHRRLDQEPPERLATGGQGHGAHVRDAADRHDPRRDHRLAAYSRCFPAQAPGGSAVRAAEPAGEGVSQHRVRADQDLAAQHGLYRHLPGGGDAAVRRAPAADQDADRADLPVGFAAGDRQPDVQHPDHHRRPVAVDLGGGGGTGLPDRHPQGRVLPQRADCWRADQCQGMGTAPGDAGVRGGIRAARGGGGADLLCLPEE